MHVKLKDKNESSVSFIELDVNYFTEKKQALQLPITVYCFSEDTLLDKYASLMLATCFLSLGSNNSTYKYVCMCVCLCVCLCDCVSVCACARKHRRQGVQNVSNPNVSKHWRMRHRKLHSSLRKPNFEYENIYFVRACSHPTRTT